MFRVDRFLRFGVLLAVCTTTIVSADAQDKAKKPVKSPYLTEDGKLTAPLEVRDEKKGFGIFFGLVWRVQPDGSWTAIRIDRNQPKLRGRGKLKPEELEQLAKALEKAQVLTLPNLGRKNVNPHVVTIQYGPKRATLVFGVDQRLQIPLPGAGKADNPVTRFAIVLGAVRAVIDRHIGPEEPLPRRLR